MTGGHHTGEGALFSARQLAVIAWVTATSVVFFNIFIKFVNRQLLGNPYGTPVYWPVSIFVFRLGRLRLDWAIPMLVAAVGVFAVTAWYLREERTRLAPVVVAGFVLLVCSNLLHGFTHGFVVPLSTREGYYQLAATIVDPLAFVRTYEANQLSYVVHARTHPPGTVLTFTLLDWVFGSRPLVTTAIAAISLPTSAVLVYRLVGTYYERSVAQYTTLLFVLLPSVQIFYLATIDAIIATLLLAAVYFFTRESRWWSLATLACLLVAASQLFLFVFVLPILAGIAVFRREKLLPLVGIGVGLVACYLVVKFGLGYDYLHSLSIASEQQNPNGFMLLADPSDYVFSRFEDIVELGLFFTPFLCLLAARGLRDLWGDLRPEGRWWLTATREREPFVIAAAAVVGFCAMLVAGVYHTGETARGALYIYPYLCLPVAAAVHRVRPNFRDRWLLVGAVFGQTLLLQLLGSYLW
ncbi:hypothetical protein [Halococcus sp. IIIV-5B]|uniref:hypothetical protein n=1 Tax=Halococcus sp. IIIV-5B TaxID=2321230 RepID=UPI000E762DB9|nr:hypothetical protein [Halococcus sp. IIIV-5B]RJT02177.1 hypothetical protein D3261_13385 [Halococcus sp. IIIV-5B]